MSYMRCILRINFTVSLRLAKGVAGIIGTAHIVCGAASMQLSGVRPSSRPSVPSGRRMLRVCCCGPDDQAIRIDCRSAVSKCRECHVVS